MIDRFAWDQSPHLQSAVRKILEDWGQWSRGGWTNLGYRSHIPGTSPPQEASENRLLRARIDVDLAKQSEFIISTLCAATDHRKGAILLKMRYVHGLDGERLAKRYRREMKLEDGDSVILARLADAEWAFASLME